MTKHLKTIRLVITLVLTLVSAYKAVQELRDQLKAAE